MRFSETARAAPAIAGSGPQTPERFGRRLDETNNTFHRRGKVARRLRLQFLASRLHVLGPKPLFHFLDELEHGADLQSHLETFAALPSDLIKAYGGDRFAPMLWPIDGGRL